MFLCFLILAAATNDPTEWLPHLTTVRGGQLSHPHSGFRSGNITIPYILPHLRKLVGPLIPQHSRNKTSLEAQSYQKTEEQKEQL